MAARFASRKQIRIRTSAFGICIRLCAFNTALARKGLAVLKALWGGHTAALQFMLGRQLQVGERKHAIQGRRLQEDIMVTCIRHILQAMGRSKVMITVRTICLDDSGHKGLAHFM